MGVVDAGTDATKTDAATTDAGPIATAVSRVVPAPVPYAASASATTARCARRLPLERWTATAA